MGIKKVEAATCDSPVHTHDGAAEIDTTEQYVDAMVYGCAFHLSCWKQMTGMELAKALDLDQIDLVDPNVTRDYQRTRVIYYGMFTRGGA